MTLEYQLVQPPFSEVFLQEFTEISEKVFASASYSNLKWRLTRMPDVTVFVARSEDEVVGYKAGYASTHKRYYSWLGGVAPEFREGGIAKRLMQEQHGWLTGTRYQLVETHVEQSNPAMIQLNLASGFAITGMYLKAGRANYIMQRHTSSSREG